MQSPELQPMVTAGREAAAGARARPPTAAWSGLYSEYTPALSHEGAAGSSLRGIKSHEKSVDLSAVGPRAGRARDPPGAPQPLHPQGQKPGRPPRCRIPLGPLGSCKIPRLCRSCHLQGRASLSAWLFLRPFVLAPSHSPRSTGHRPALRPPPRLREARHTPRSHAAPSGPARAAQAALPGLLAAASAGLCWPL